MSLQMILVRVDGEDLACPVLTCDGCGRQITDPEAANVLYEPTAVEQGTPPRFAHKGRCDHDMDAGRDLYWVEMSKWLDQLTYNTTHAPAITRQVIRR